MISRARKYFCKTCVCVCVCRRACALGAYTSYFHSGWYFFFSCIHNSRAVSGLVTASRQKPFGTSAIQGPWKCTHSLAQLVPKGVPA